MDVFFFNFHQFINSDNIFFSAESLMYRSIVGSQNVSPLAIRDDIKMKITALEASESLSEKEFVDMIEFHQENTCIISMAGLQHKGIPELKETESNKLYFGFH